jgi:hypothetical protein
MAVRRLFPGARLRRRPHLRFELGDVLAQLALLLPALESRKNLSFEIGAIRHGLELQVALALQPGIDGDQGIAFQQDAHLTIGPPLGLVLFQVEIQETIEICGNALVHQRRRRHDRYTIDQLPPLLLGRSSRKSWNCSIVVCGLRRRESPGIGITQFSVVGWGQTLRV